MILLPTNIKPENHILTQLKEYQKEIDILATFELKSEKAKDLFPARNKIGNKTFDAVKEKLTAMCSGARRCVYCEDSVADEVEHIHPKDLFPHLCFDWNNYVYACGTCNGPKNNKFAIFRNDNGTFYHVNPPRGQIAKEPPLGEDALVNPRIEDPLNYCMLDLESTFKFVVTAKTGTKESLKADYTFNEVLRLNEREVLRKARKSAYGNYKARLYQYTDQKIKGAIQTKLDLMIEEIKSEAHPTVWKEIQRHHTLGYLRRIDIDLDTLFLGSPEALNW